MVKIKFAGQGASPPLPMAAYAHAYVHEPPRPKFFVGVIKHSYIALRKC